jgi:thioredoxin-related protein
MDRGERRRIRKRKIKQRMNKAKHFIPAWVYKDKSAEEIFDIPGYFSNNNEMNKYANGGCAKKTKSRKGHQTYRHKGTYGKAVNYSKHDQQQVDDMNYQERELI